MSADESRPDAVGNETAIGEALAGSTNVSNSTSASPARPPIQATFEETLTNTTVADYLAEIADMPDVTLPQIRDDLLSRLSGVFAVETRRRKDEDIPAPLLVKPKVLDELSVVQVLLARESIKRIDFTDGDGDEDLTQLAMYQSSGPDQGLHLSTRAVLARVISQIRPSSTTRATDSIVQRLEMHAPIVYRTKQPHLIPVNNGVFDHKNQELLPFSADCEYSAHWGPSVVHPGTSWRVCR